MLVREIGTTAYYGYPIVGGPLDGHILTTKGPQRPDTLRVVLHAHIAFKDKDRRSLLPEWRDMEGESYASYAKTIYYEWSKSTCAYILTEATEAKDDSIL